MPNVSERRHIIADAANSSPRSPNGVTITLRVSLYDTDGHAAIDVEGVTDGTLNCNDDYELGAEFLRLIGLMRARQRRTRSVEPNTGPWTVRPA